ncbi:MAG: J domain-containing protein [Lachnospiraceae bacterium]|nr:J domain-containing protein [Lachnospiraceae bacterium]
MLDPYMVLGVGKYDDDQTVKKAYRALSKQYHPDNNLNNPNKDAAEETFKKIQQAYEQVMHERSIGIGGPNDPGRARAEAEKQARQAQQQYQSQTQNTYNQYNNTRTAEKERSDNSNTWWNNSAFNENREQNSFNTGNNGFDQSYNNSYDQNNDGYNNSDYNYGYSQNNQYTGNSGYGNSGGYYTGTGRENYNRDQNQNYGGYYSGQADYTNRFTYSTRHNERDDAIMAEAAQCINNKNFFRAIDLLNTVKFKNDVWYYYSGVANLGLGNNVTALTHAKIALNMQPNRTEYQELVNCIDSNMMQYQGKAEMFKPHNPGEGGKLCVKLIIANIALNIFCGGSGAVCNGLCAVC